MGYVFDLFGSAVDFVFRYYIVTYVVLSAISVVCAVMGSKNNKNGLMKVWCILSFVAGFVLAIGLYDAAERGSGPLVYVSVSGGLGGVSLLALLQVFLYAPLPMIIGALVAYRVSGQ